MDILQLIPNGAENAISRKDLAAATGLNDRTMREAIEQLRHNGHLICSKPTGGYYQPTNIEDIERMYRTELKRAKAILHRLTPLRQALKQEGRL